MITNNNQVIDGYDASSNIFLKIHFFFKQRKLQVLLRHHPTWLLGSTTRKMIVLIDGLLVFRFVVITDNLTPVVVNSCHSVSGVEITYKLIFGMPKNIPRTHLPFVLPLFSAACVIPQFNRIENFVNEWMNQSEIPSNPIKCWGCRRSQPSKIKSRSIQ